MMVGGYTLDLYCDRFRCTTKASYYGESGEKCRVKARKEGWKVAMSKNRVLCPKCNGSSQKRSEG